jgi:pimeloyl-ACP methyl ester carboxylesterase
MLKYEKVTGKYLHLEVDGLNYRIYMEENGSGIPLLLQHTAGSDGRLWRHLLNDEEIAKSFRMIAYDLPYHGKSLPPLNANWWQEEYHLTQDFLMKFVVTLSHALGLDRPCNQGSFVGSFYIYIINCILSH